MDKVLLNMPLHLSHMRPHRPRRTRRRQHRSLFSRRSATPAKASPIAKKQQLSTPKPAKKIISPQRSSSLLVAKAIITALSSPCSSISSPVAGFDLPVAGLGAATEGSLMASGQAETDVAVATAMALIGQKKGSLEKITRGSVARLSVHASMSKLRKEKGRGLSHYGDVPWAERTFDLSEMSLKAKSFKTKPLFEKIEVETDKLSPWDTARCATCC